MLSIEEIATKWENGSFEDKLALQLEMEDKTKPFIIWRKEENKPTPQNPRSVMKVVPFVQHLDACHGNVETVVRYQSEGFQIAYWNIPETIDLEKADALRGVRALLDSGDKMKAQIRAELMAEYGIKEKVAAKAKKLEEAA